MHECFGKLNQIALMNSGQEIILVEQFEELLTVDELLRKIPDWLSILKKEELSFDQLDFFYHECKL